MAVKELVNEAKRAKERSQTMGTYGWQKRKATTNKRFLHNTLVSTLREYNTDTRHRRKRYGLDSRTIKSDWSKSLMDDTNSKLAGDAILDEANHNSTSRHAAPAEVDAALAEVDAAPAGVDAAPAGSVARSVCPDGGLTREREQVGVSISSDPVVPGNKLHCEREGKHRKRSRSKSPHVKETYSDDDGRKGHHGHGRKSKSSKHKRKRKHKDRHSKGHKSSRR